MTFRGFVAVDIPPSPSLEQFAEQLHNASASLKVVSTDQLHLTVKFETRRKDSSPKLRARFARRAPTFGRSRLPFGGPERSRVSRG